MAAGRRTLGTAALVAVGAGAACGDDPEGPTDTTAPTTTASVGSGPLRAAPASVVLTSDEAATIYYTTDGAEPDEASPSGPTPVTVTTTSARGSPLEGFLRWLHLLG